MICVGTSSLPCPASPSSAVTGLYVPSCRHNLLSLPALQRLGVRALFPAGALYCDLHHHDQHLARFTLSPTTRLYTLRVPIPSFVHHTSSSSAPPVSSCDCRSLTQPTLLLHHRLGHPNFPLLRSMVNLKLLHDLPSSLQPLPLSPAPPCTPCVQAKLSHSPHPSSPSASPKPLDLVHMDLWGPSPIASCQGHRYLLLLVDNHSCFATVYPLNAKSDAPSLIIRLAEQARLRFGLRFAFGLLSVCVHACGRGAGGGRGRGRGGRGGRGGGVASMKSAGNESESRDDRFPGQFFFVSTQAPAGPEKDESFEELAAVGKVTLHSLDYWVIDSGATYSMTPRADLLTELEPSPVKHVTSALGQRAEVKGMGKAMFKGADGKMVGLKNVLWVPNLAANLISMRQLQKAGMDTSSKGAKTYTARLGERILWDLHEDRDVYNKMWQIPVVPMPKERQVAASISTKGEAVGSGDGANGRAKEIESKKCNLGGTSKLGEHEESGLAAKEEHKGEENPKAAAEEEYGESMWGTIASAAFSNPTSATGECDWLTLHRRMGHVALLILQQLVKDEMVAGIRVKGEPDELGAAGAEYFLTIVDVYTRMTWVYVLSKKSDVAETVKTDWLPMVERQQDRLVKAIRNDRGGEFLSKEFLLWLKKNGIRHSLTMPYSLAMNGIAERANRTITETVRGLLIEAGLPDYFWPDAVRSACVAKNRALTHVGADKWVPYVEWVGRKPKVDMLRVFGCMCMALVPKHLRHNKLGAKAIWAVHLGMAQNSKGWLLWDPFTKKFLVSRDCKFMENLMYKDWKAENEAKIGMRFGEVKSSGLEHVELPLEMSSSSTTTRQSYLVNGGEEAKDAEEEEEEVQQLGEGEQRSFMVVYVDDILIFSPSSDLVKEVMLKLQDKFKCKALGDVSFYLGLHIERDVEKRCMRVHQRKYLEALVANFGQSEGHVATHFLSGFKCVKGPEEESVGEEERRRFHSLVGSLMYAAANMRPDVAFATGQLARVFQCPYEEHVAAGMRVAKYLGQTPTVGLQYSAAAQRRQKGADGVEPGRLFLTAFSDASYASEPENMKSVGGFICCVGGGPTAWESKKQVDQALSLVEFEYMALFRVVREIVW
ncbi:unnamed protein product [Closterium sp. NIES-54]